VSFRATSPHPSWAFLLVVWYRLAVAILMVPRSIAFVVAEFWMWAHRDSWVKKHPWRGRDECHVLTFISVVLSLFSMVRAWVGVGSLCLFFYDLGISMFRPSMVLNQRQVSLVVSDWELYLGSLGFTVCLWVIVYVSCLCQHSSHYSVTFIVLYSLYSVFSFIKISSWTQTTLHFGLLHTTNVTMRELKERLVCVCSPHCLYFGKQL
jgi:hypothetical protein